MDLLIGSHPLVESLGEAKKIPYVQTAISNGSVAKCNCGSSVAQCPFWVHVLGTGLSFEEKNPKDNAELFSRALSFRGRSVILDNSKNSGRARMLSRSGLFQMHILHVVRDSRAVFFSHRRKAQRRGSGEKSRLYRVAREWSRLNRRLARSFDAQDGVRYVRVRYEDLVADPGRELKRVFEAASLPWTEQVLSFRESCHHGIEGNRMRLETGQQIVRDDEYLKGLTVAEWWATTALTWRTLGDFGYRLRR